MKYLLNIHEHLNNKNSVSKNLKNVMSVITLILLMLMSVNVGAQEKKNSLTLKEFSESVLIVQDFTNVRINKSKALEIKILNFHSEKELESAYMINGIEYCDNGKFKDKVAGDGIYTSVKNIKIIKLQEKSVMLNMNEAFKHDKELNKYLDDKLNVSGKVKVKFGCKTRLASCPETSWWNDCWFGSPCTCIELHDCEIEIEYES